MAIRPIRLFPDPVLSEACQPISIFDDHLGELLRDLTDTLYHSPGVGIAAPQIGVPLRVSIIDIGRRSTKDTVSSSHHGIISLINPVLLKGAGLQIPREGCLSVPDWLANVRRYAEVVVQTQTREGGEKVIKSHGFEALALQHEIDHLDGKLFLDRVVDLKTDLFRRKTYR